MTKKQLYETPEAEVLVVKIEQNIMSDPVKPWEPDDDPLE